MSWQSEFRDAVKTEKDLKNLFGSEQIHLDEYKTFIPNVFAQKIQSSPQGSALRKQFLPSTDEELDIGFIDPIGDSKSSKGSGIIHRYKNRILFTPTEVCPVNCRYCFRKNTLGTHDETFKANLSKLDDYLSQHLDVNEVILTGGDPLVLSNQKISQISKILIKNKIKFFRFHTRTPVILPNRIDDDFCSLLKELTNSFIRIIFVVHTNHSDELTEDVKVSLLKLSTINKVDLKTQTVLLKGVNNTTKALLSLFYRAIDCGLTPYYLHHPDLVKGAMHFYLPLSEGRKIYLKLRKELPGWAIPHYIIDHPNAKGKQLAFNPESIDFSGKLLDLEANFQEYSPLNH